MKESHKRALGLGIQGLIVLAAGIFLLTDKIISAGAILVGLGSVLLGVAAMYLDPPGRDS
jgi:hypothetical protein